MSQGLEKTNHSFLNKFQRLFAKKKVSDDILDDIEELLISSDVGMKTAFKMMDRLEELVQKQKYTSSQELWNLLKKVVLEFIEEKVPLLDEKAYIEKNSPCIFLVVGVNGVGKTTTIGKLAYRFKAIGKSVMLGAGDTFRAAAVEQISIWAQKTDSLIVKQAMGSDPAAVVFDTVKSGVAKGVDVIILDTAGRLHNKENLMRELSKIKKVIQKVDANLQTEVLLIIDGTMGQSALNQAQKFIQATDVNALVVTKLDGTAKGGMIFSLLDEWAIPVRYIGTGERAEDLSWFDSQHFVDAFFEREK